MNVTPRKEVVIGVAAQDVQISAYMTRLHGCERAAPRRLKAKPLIEHNWIPAGEPV